MFLRQLGFKISATVVENRASPLSDPGIPLVASIFPEPTLSAPDLVEPVGQLDAHHIFCVLVAELPFDPQPERGAMTVVSSGRRLDYAQEWFADGKRRSDRCFRNNCPVPSSVCSKNVCAMEDNEPGRGEKRRLR